MTGEIGAAGELVSGALAARAVEPRAGERAGGRPGALCLNCGTRLIGEHCHACGQSGHVHRSVGAIGHELLHGVFHFEGKVWRTLPLLVFRPGELTRRYVAGERARFVSPLALFLFTVFLMFAAISFVGAEVSNLELSPTERAAASRESAEVARRTRAELARLRRDRAVAATAGRPTADIDDRIASAETSIRFLDGVAAANGGDGEGGAFNIPKTGWTKLDKGVAKANRNPGLMLYKLQTSAYKYSWLLIPLSTPFVALLFLWRRGFGLYDHAIFVTYSLSFMMLLVVALTLGGVAGLAEGVIALTATFAPPLHMYKQLRGAYALRRLSAIWRTAALAVFATVALSTFFLLILFQGLTG